MRRRAVSLLEILMFALVGSMVLYIMYDIFVASARQGQDLDRKLKAVQGAQLLLERLERDLKHLIYVPAVYEPVVDEEGHRIVFHLFDGHGEDMSDGVIPIHRREYRFDPATRRVLIDDVVYSASYFRAVEFQLGEAGEGSEVGRPVLTIRIGGVAEDVAQLTEEELDLRTRADFVSSVGLASMAEAKRQPYWRTNLQYKLR
jgi:hypothetical protein